MSNIIDKLMEKDLDTLKEAAKKDLEITRLSKVFNEPFTVTVKEISYKRITDLRMLATDDGVADESQFLQFGRYCISRFWSERIITKISSSIKTGIIYKVI